MNTKVEAVFRRTRAIFFLAPGHHSAPDANEVETALNQDRIICWNIGRASYGWPMFTYIQCHDVNTSPSKHIIARDWPLQDL